MTALKAHEVERFLKRPDLEAGVFLVYGPDTGLVREVAEVALPIGVRRGRLYVNLVDATLRFMIEDVGQVDGVYPGEEKLANDFLLRRTVGNGIDFVDADQVRAAAEQAGLDEARTAAVVEDYSTAQLRALKVGLLAAALLALLSLMSTRQLPHEPPVRRRARQASG